MLILAIGFSAAAIFPFAVVASENAESSADTPTSVTPPDTPTAVTVGVYLIGLSEVSEPSDPFPTYEVEIFLNLSWRDPRLAFADRDTTARVFQEEEAEEKLSEIWSPDLEIQNEVEQRQTESIELTIYSDGTVDYEEQFGAKLNAELDLRRFPFDHQTFDIEFQSFTWDVSELVLHPNEAQTGFDTDFETPEWTVMGVASLIDVSSEVRDDTEFSAYSYRINAHRHAGHYILRIFLPVLFVMCIAWAAFWQPAKDERARVGFIALLTVVALHMVIADDLPRLKYPTFADAMLLVCYMVATSLTVVGIFVQRREADGRIELAQKIDRRAKWLVPLIGACILGLSVLILWF
jgi:hypothetical protein